MEFYERKEKEYYSIAYAQKGKETKIFYFFKEQVDVQIEQDKYIIYTFQQCKHILLKYKLKRYSILLIILKQKIKV